MARDYQLIGLVSLPPPIRGKQQSRLAGDLGQPLEPGRVLSKGFNQPCDIIPRLDREAALESRGCAGANHGLVPSPLTEKQLTRAHGLNARQFMDGDTCACAIGQFENREEKLARFRQGEVV